MQVIFRKFFNFYNIFFTVLDFSDERSRFAPYREDKAGNSFPQLSENFSDQVRDKRIRELKRTVSSEKLPCHGKKHHLAVVSDKEEKEGDGQAEQQKYYIPCKSEFFITS